MYVKSGQQVRAFKSAPDRIGEVIVLSHSAEEAEKKAKSISNKVIIDFY
jgi:hypothetical protein